MIAGGVVFAQDFANEADGDLDHRLIPLVKGDSYVQSWRSSAQQYRVEGGAVKSDNGEFGGNAIATIEVTNGPQFDAINARVTIADLSDVTGETSWTVGDEFMRQKLGASIVNEGGVLYAVASLTIEDDYEIRVKLVPSQSGHDEAVTQASESGDGLFRYASTKDVSIRAHFHGGGFLILWVNGITVGGYSDPGVAWGNWLVAQNPTPTITNAELNIGGGGAVRAIEFAKGQ